MLWDIWNYLKTDSLKYYGLVREHMQISFLVIMLAAVLGVALAMATYRSMWANQLFTGILSILRIIPSLAILILCIPLLGVGKLPAGAALTLLAVPPVYIHTIMAFQTIPAHVIETAEGLGIGRNRIFWKIRLPLALPSILTGIRLCAIEVIASATIASYIGGGGIGNMILTGLNLYRMDLLLLGGMTVAALAIVTDLLFLLLERHITAYRRKGAPA